MDNDEVHSFEKLSVSDNDRAGINRVIVANRHQPEVFWSTSNQPTLEAQGLNLFARLCSWCLCQDNSTTLRYFSGRRLRSRSNSISIVDETQIDTGPFSSNEWRTSKYTLLNFLPKNLFEQFRRLANFYFLSTAIMQLVIPFSPVGPTTSFLPLLFVVSTTAIKQAYEDYLRHKLDREVNNRACHVLRNKQLVRVHSKDIRVGDIVCVKNNEEIPCDMILLASSGGAGTNSISGDRCYVTTANLDGETSLKSRTCFLVKSLIGTIDKIDNTLMVLECEQPNATLYEFNGILRATKDEREYKRLTEDIERQIDYNARRPAASGAAASAVTSNKYTDRNANKLSSVTKTVNSTGGSKIGGGGATSSGLFTDDLPTKAKCIITHIYNRIKKTNIHLAGKTINTDANHLHQQQQQDGTRADNDDKNPSTIATDSVHIESAAEHVEIALDISNLLLRASRLRNTTQIFGLVVHTGRDTKLAHNSQVKANKFSSTESKVNMFLLIAFLILVLMSLVSAILYQAPDFWYFRGLARADSFVEILLAHFLLYNYIVPISLYVTLEFIKFFGTLAVIKDKKLTSIEWRTANTDNADEETNGGKNSNKTNNNKTHKIKVLEEAKCNSSDLNEDLGQIEVLFSDKTGTLTENVMQFMACSVNGQLYRCQSKKLYQQPANSFKLQVPNVVQKLASQNVNRYSILGQSATSSIRSAVSSTVKSHSSVEADPAKAPKDRPFDHRRLPPLKDLKLVDKLEDNENVVEFFMSLCLCSTVALNETVPWKSCLPDQMEPDYQSASPDEKSLIEAAAWFGVTMCKSNEHECYIAIKRSRLSKEAGKTHHDHFKQNDKFRPIVETKNSNSKFIVRHFERLLAFEFNSTRKRMSVIYKDCDNDCLLLVTKGSESVLDCVTLSSLSAAKELQVNLMMAHFEAFSKSGLRTMLVANKLLDHKEYSMISEEIRSARVSSANREQLLDHLYRRVESKLHFVGTTAVEDILQEGVAETIADLKEAGVHVWLLTGDKVETAISVAYSCKLLDRSMSLLYLVKQHDAKACQELLESICRELKQVVGEESSRTAGSQEAPTSGGIRHLKSLPLMPGKKSKSNSPTGSGTTLGSPLNRFGLIIDGRSLHYAMKYAKSEFEFICRHCICVLGCRLSPLQKAEVVDMVKQGEDEPITAAIGDGANDVSMIQEAHVGIGIAGKEGRQAVNSSDFAIKRFHMLSRLLFVHGHLFYHRTAYTILYFFYKNLLFIFPQFLYTFYNLSSATSIYHPIMLIGFNLIFTSGPILLYGLGERHIDESTLEQCPKLYQNNRRNYLMRFSLYLSWLWLAVIQSIIAFYLLYLNFGSHRPFMETGQMSGLIGFELVLFHVIVITATLKLYFLARYHGLYFNLVILVSLLLLPLTLVGISLVDTSYILGTNSLYHQVIPMLRSPMFWLAVASTTVASILPDIYYILD